MRIQIILGIFTILLLACCARASIGHTQGLEIGALNRVEWGGGVGSANGQNDSIFGQEQDLSDTTAGMSFAQRERGTFSQVAFAGGTSGPSSVEQNTTVTGGQEQLGTSNPGPPSCSSQQNLTGHFGDVVFKPEGIGSAGATQTYESTQVQTMAMPSGTAVQSQTLRTSQYAGIGTQTNVDPLVTNSLNIQLNQRHGVNTQSLATP